MTRALSLAATPGVPLGPNPRVGCVLLDAAGHQVAEGYHRGAGTSHAEVDALSGAGSAARGTTAVVTLEPCCHTGRTGPCAQALIEAGVARVVYAMTDPNPVAAGGASLLREAGVEIVEGVEEERAHWLNRAWLFGLAQGRPLVTWKLATTIDGFSAAVDGTSRWISSAPARRDVHRLRGEADVVLAGTGTVEFDDPRLTVRDERGQELAVQPLRAVMGLRELSPDSRVLDETAPTMLLPTRDPGEALQRLFDAGRRHVFLEGGPRLAAAFLSRSLVDEVVAYVAPTLLGAGRSVVADLGIHTLADALHFELTETTVLGERDEACVRMVMRRG